MFAKREFLGCLILSVGLAGCGKSFTPAQFDKNSVGAQGASVNSAATVTTFFAISSPANGMTFSAPFRVTGTAGAQWVNIAAYDTNNGNNKVGADVAPTNGTYTVIIDTTKMGVGTHTLKIMAFSVAAGQSGGTSRTLMLSVVVASVATPTPTPAPTPPPQSGPAATRAADFLNSLGMNVQMNNNGTIYGNLAQIQSELTYLGIKNLRDQPPQTWLISNYQTMAAAGYKFDFIISRDPNEQLNATEIQTNLGIIKQVASVAPGSIIGLEGLNEPYNAQFDDYWDGTLTNNWSTVLAVQQAEYSAVKADSILNSVPVMNSSINDDSFSGAAPNMAPFCNFANSHVYPYSGLQPKTTMDWQLNSQSLLVPGKAPWITELGYNVLPSDTSYGVDAATAAKNTTTGLLYAYKSGFKKTFIYLLNQYVDTSTNSWDLEGMYTSTGKVQPVGVAIHNLTTVLADKGATAASFAPQGYSGFTITGLPSLGGDLVMQKSDGTYEIALYNNANDWNPTAHAEQAVPTSTVTISLGATYSSVMVYDVMVGTSPIATYSKVSKVQVGLSDHPVIVQVKF